MTYGVVSCDLLDTTSPAPSFSIAAEVVPSCEIDVTSLNFGVIDSSLNSHVDERAAVNVRCTSNTSYSVTLDNGTGPGASGPTSRVLQNGAHTLIYGLYQNAARSMPWGRQPGNSVSAVGQGSNQSFPIFGRIFSGQSAHFGVYTDSVVVTVNY